MARRFVGLGGSNGYVGDVPGAPWLHWDYAFSQIGPGDILEVLPGTYTNALDRIDSQAFAVPSGTAYENAVTVRAYQGLPVVIQPTGSNPGIRLTDGGAYRVVQDIQADMVNSSSMEAVYLSSGANHNRFRRVLCRRGFNFGFVVSRATANSPFNEFLDCISTDHGRGSVDPTVGHGVYLTASDTLFRGGRIYECGGVGIHSYDNAGTKAVSRNVFDRMLIENNLGIYGVVFAWGDGCVLKSSVVRGHVNGPGLSFYTGCSGAKAYKNTIVENLYSVTGQNMDGDGLVRDNVLYGNTTNAPVDYGGGAGALVLTNNLLTNPLFVNAGAGNYRIQAASAARDSGTNLPEVTDDFDGLFRPQGIVSCRGAFEYPASGGGPVPDPAPDDPEPGPDPDIDPDPDPEPEPEPEPVPTTMVPYSDIDMADPPEYYGGFKAAQVVAFGDGERAASHPRTGEWTGANFSLKLSDAPNLVFRRRMANNNSRWNRRDCWPVRMVSRPERAELGTAYTVFNGPVINAQPSSTSEGLVWDVTLGDIVSKTLLSDNSMIPWRQVRDSFLSQLTVNEDLDLDRAEPIIYGKCLRQLNINPTPVDAFVYCPFLLGKETIDGDEWWVWMVCGHALADVIDLYVDDDSVIADEGTDWLVPHFAGHTALFTTPYEDRVSDTYGNLRRYSLVRGKVGEADPDACAAGDKVLSIACHGIEPNGDGSGDAILDRLDQYEDFLNNHVSNYGPNSYMSGPRLTSAVWTRFDDTVPIVEAISFARCKSIGRQRLGADGYRGAGIIGATPGDRSSVKRWIAEWNRSSSTRFGITHLGQMRVFMLHPTGATKASAPLYTDAYEVLQGSFGTDIQWDEQANRIPFRADFEHSTGQWKTSDVAIWPASVAVDGDITGELRDYLFAPGITQSYSLARLEAIISANPPRTIRLDVTVGPLGMLDLGDYITYRHFAAIGAAAQIRLAQIVKHQVQAGQRRVMVEAIDCEDLIGYDANVGESDAPVMYPTCADAIEIDGELVSESQQWNVNTTLAPTDASVAGVMPGGRVAYAPTWAKVTTSVDLTITVGFTAAFNGQILVLTGTCGGDDWEVVVFTDLATAIAFTCFAGVTYYILVTGQLPTDKGALAFGANLEPL